MKKPLAILVALGLTAAGLVTAVPAQADTVCTINNFSPRSVAIGRSPKAVDFPAPSVSGCTLTDWTISGDLFFVYKDNPQEVFYVPSNSDAGKTQDVVVEATNSDYDSRSKVFADSFALKRYTGWDGFNATPEPVTKGKTITIKGRLRITNWDEDRYDAFTNRLVAVEFRPANSTVYKQVKTATTTTGGYLTTTVKASTDGYWRYRYVGNSYASGATSTGDYVDVK